MLTDSSGGAIMLESLPAPVFQIHQPGQTRPWSLPIGVDPGSPFGTGSIRIDIKTIFTCPTPLCASDTITVEVAQIADLDVDSNNDGTIDPDNEPTGSDDPIEADSPGKWIWINNDDDDVDTVADGQNGTIDGADDLGDVLEVVAGVMNLGAFEDPHLFLELTDPAVLRVFQQRAADSTELLGPTTSTRVEVPFATAGWTFGAEGLAPGSATVSLVLEDGGIEVCRDEVVMSVVTVALLGWDEWADYSTPLDPCPNNAGQRMFPDKRYVVDTFANDRNKVALQATVNPVVEGFPVQFRVWDVDDPFDQNNPGMANVAVIDGDASGPDNRIPGGGADPAVVEISVNTDQDGVARATIEVSMPPGNNYRGGASTMSDGLVDAKITQDLVDLNTPPPQAVFSEMMTIWRKVWLELDSMAAGTDITTSVDVGGLIRGAPHVGETTIQLPDAYWIGDDGRFEGGVLGLDAGGTQYPIIDNVGTDYVVTGDVPDSAIVDFGRITDDDTTTLPRTPDADITVLNDKYRNGYVEFTENSATRDNDNVFVATLPYSDDAVAAKGFESADLTPEENFWAAIIVTCYQSHHDESGANQTTNDADPDPRYHFHPGLPGCVTV